jgi:inactivated superfamily I helicase
MPFYFARAGYLLEESKNFILQKYGHILHDVIVVVPNVYAANQLSRLFVSKDLNAGFLPKIIPIEEIKVIENRIITLDKAELANYFEHQLIITKIIFSSSYYNFSLRQSLDLSKSILVLLHEFMKSGCEPIDLSKLNYEHFLQLQTLGAFLQEVKEKWLFELSQYRIGDVIDVCLKSCKHLSEIIQNQSFLSKLVLIDVTEAFCWELIKNLHYSEFDIIVAAFAKDETNKTPWIRPNLTKLLKHCDFKFEDVIELSADKDLASNEKIPINNVSYKIFPNEIKELNFIASFLLDTIQAEPLANIAVILEDGEMIHTLVQVLQGYNIDVRNLVGLSLTRNIAIQFLLLIATLQKHNALVKDLIALLKHPYFDTKISENFEHLAISQGLILQSLEEAKLRLKEQHFNVYQIYTSALFIDSEKASFKHYLQSHLQIAQRLFPLIWEDSEYLFVQEYIKNLFNASQHLELIPKEAYGDILTTLLQGKYYAESPLESRICILSPKDTAFLDAKFVVVPNFHDSSWPNLGDSDVWLSDNIRSEMGLSDVRSDQLENYRGYFSNLMYFSNVLFTRSYKFVGKDTIESRFWSQNLTMASIK